MGIRYFRTGISFTTVGSNRYLLIPTTNVTRIFLSTGYTGIRIYNSGSHSLIWGGSSLSTNSGSFLYPGMATDFGPVQDNFDFYMIADSANSFVSITEYIS